MDKQTNQDWTSKCIQVHSTDKTFWILQDVIIHAIQKWPITNNRSQWINLYNDKGEKTGMLPVHDVFVFTEIQDFQKSNQELFIF